MCVGVAQKDLNRPLPKPLPKPKQGKIDFPEAKLQAIYPNSYHINLWKKAAIIPQTNPEEPKLATFGWMAKDWKDNPRTCFNVRVEGGEYKYNTNNDPNYSGPYTIWTNPYVKSIIKTQRCIIPCDAFIEQPTEDKKKRVKRKFVIKKKDSSRMYLAGVYNEIANEDTGEIVDTAFTILTTARTKITEKALHHRSPVIIPDEYIFDYLDTNSSKEQLEAFFPPLDSIGFMAYEVDPVIAKRELPEGYTNDDSRLFDPIGELMYA